MYLICRGNTLRAKNLFASKFLGSYERIFLLKQSIPEETFSVGLICQVKSQSNELSRGPPELVQYFVYMGSSHRRKSAECPKFYMVWLYRYLAQWGGGG